MAASPTVKRSEGELSHHLRGVSSQPHQTDPPAKGSIITAVYYLVLVALVVAAAAGIYYLGDRTTRHLARNISAIAFGVTFALQAVLTYHDHSGRWEVWFYAVAAIAMPVVLIWSSRREERRKFGR